MNILINSYTINASILRSDKTNKKYLGHTEIKLQISIKNITRKVVL